MRWYSGPRCLHCGGKTWGGVPAAASAGLSTLATGLVELGILVGQPEDLVDQDAHALFFPHGVGHLLGLDVHDMRIWGTWRGMRRGAAAVSALGWAFCG